MEEKYTDPSIRTLRHPSPAASLFGYINWNFEEANTFLYRPKGWWMLMAKMLASYWLDLPFRFTSGKDRRLTQGNALAGSLRIGLNRNNVPLWLESPLTELIEDNGRVTGAIVRHKGKDMRIGARKGVILAAGGFDKNQEMREENAPLYKNAQYSGGTGGNTGDSIRAGKSVGAATMNMHSAWAAPVWYVPGEPGGRLCTMERALPGGMIVAQSGERFMNEAASYHIVGQQMAARQAEHRDANPAWFVFDAEYRRKYPAGQLLPVLPDWAQDGQVKTIMMTAGSIAELAGEIGVDPAALEATVTRFNTCAAKGEDPDFQRGEAAYDKMYGDPSVQPNPCLAPVDKGPFYAMPIYPGDIGTNGGLTTDEKARVLNEKGKPIGGLYAVGNNAASAMGESYPGAGVTIGPALTFGYVAARDAMGVNS
jgi:3-oxosteroid 1-dehydrogenase